MAPRFAPGASVAEPAATSPDGSAAAPAARQSEAKTASGGSLADRGEQPVPKLSATASAKPAGQAAAPAAQPAPNPPRPAPTPVAKVQPPSQAAEPAAVPAPPIGRMVIFNTEVGLLVKDLGEAINAMGDIATQAGGYVAGVEHKEEAGRPLAVVKLKVPPDRYEPTMRQLRQLAVEVSDEKAATQDVTEEFNDLQTQLTALEASHAQLVELVGRAQNVEEILKIQEKLAQTKVQIDRIKGRLSFLQRSSDLATITARVRPAEDVLARTWTGLRSQLRKAESQRAATLLAIKRAKSVEEEATLRDRLAELTVEIDRVSSRLRDVERKAMTAGITLPVAQAEDTASAGAPPDDDLAREYISLRVQLRSAHVEQDRVARALRERRSADDEELRQRLSSLILEVSRLQARLKVVQERAGQLGVVLPSLTPEQEAVLAGTPVDDPTRPDPWRAARAAWDSSLQALAAVLTVVLTVVVFLWWAIPPLAIAALWMRRRRAAATV